MHVMAGLQDLVLVAGHAALKATVSVVPRSPESDEWWCLQPFQAGEPACYLEHARRGVALAADNPAALLLFSGGRTREEAGDWSEGRSYQAIAASRHWWMPDTAAAAQRELAARAASEDFARDSFENLLFGICRFRQLAGVYPRMVTVVSWGFKAPRFALHRAALRVPASQFRFDGPNDPLDLRAAWRGERLALRSFLDDPYGCGGELGAKRARRNPFRQSHPYRDCPGLQGFFAWLDLRETGGGEYPGAFPWEPASGRP